MEHWEQVALNGKSGRKRLDDVKIGVASAMSLISAKTLSLGRSRHRNIRSVSERLCRLLQTINRHDHARPTTDGLHAEGKDKRKTPQKARATATAKYKHSKAKAIEESEHEKFDDLLETWTQGCWLLVERELQRHCTTRAVSGCSGTAGAITMEGCAQAWENGRINA